MAALELRGTGQAPICIRLRSWLCTPDGLQRVHTLSSNEVFTPQIAADQQLGFVKFKQTQCTVNALRPAASLREVGGHIIRSKDDSKEVSRCTRSCLVP